MGNLECCNSVVVSENIYTPPTEDFQLVPSHSPGNSSLTFILSFKHFGEWIPIPLRIITNNLPWNRNGFFWKWMFQHSLLTESFLNTTCKFQFQFEFQSKDHLNQSFAVRKFYSLIVKLVFFDSALYKWKFLTMIMKPFWEIIPYLVWRSNIDLPLFQEKWHTCHKY